MCDQTEDEVCPKCGLEYIKRARIEEFYSPANETRMFCEDDYYVYLHETAE
jgi:hypothetical protein